MIQPYARLLLFILTMWALNPSGAKAQWFKEFEGHTGEVFAVALTPDGSKLITGSSDKTLVIWDAQSSQPLQTLKGHNGAVNALSLNATGNLLVSGGADASVRVWQLETGREIGQFHMGPGAIECVAINPQSNLVASCGFDKTARVWDLHSKLQQVYSQHINTVYGVAFSPDAEHLATSSADNTVRIWDINQGKCIMTLSGHKNTVRSVAFSPDGQWLATGSLDRSIKIWNAQTGQLQHTLWGHTDIVRHVVFSPDGRALASASRDGTVRVWNATTGGLLTELKGHSDGLWHCAFSGNGRWLASASADQTARVWDIGYLKLGGTLPFASLTDPNQFLPPLDISLNIPVNPAVNPNRFALIIGNENYSQFQPSLTPDNDVEFARADALIFRQYCEKTFGVPSKNILVLLNATSAQMQQEINKLHELAKNTGPEAEIIFYYAGHGVPDPVTNESYLLPVDVNASQPDLALKLSTLLYQLTDSPLARLTVYLDACFSGRARNVSPLAARGLFILPKPIQPRGNTVVFSASSGDQAALPYRQAGHGLFTYYLLKAVNETKGLVNYGKLAEQVAGETAVHALLIHNRAQNPVTFAAPDLGEVWKNWKF